MDARPMLNGFIRDRPAFAHVEVALGQGQEVMADGKAMIWMDGHVPIKTECGNCSAACWRCCAGEACCQNFYTGPGRVTFGFDLPGDMLPFGVTPGAGWLVAAGSFICGTKNVRVTGKFPGCAAICCGGMPLFITRITVGDQDNGMFYCGGYGAITRHEVPDKQFLYLSRGLFFAANDKIKIEGGLAGGCMGCCFGGEGLCIKIQGPAVVYSQNRNPRIWDKVLNPPPPRKKKQKQGMGASGNI
jgi:uncharacterized protein (AIM24 family)